jgi:UDP-N-acetylmuramate: L-alanyl-gamma-D-glutamyl-meso-diaminopimelate ligase
MMTNYFTATGATALSEIAPGAQVHISGVCGVAMAQLALELCRRGYLVSGSDKEFYEPMGSLLRSSPVKLYQGYSAGNIPEDAALVVIGNALSYSNEEVQEVERRALRYSLFPQMYFDVAIRGRHSIVVSGTHGKSTTSALLAWLLTKLNLDPSFFVGAVIPDLPSSLVVGNGTFCVTEGDEYDSAFFAKVPKFTFYRPDTLIVTAIEYDHADIYPNLEAIEEQFTKLVMNLPPDAVAICCCDDPNVARLVGQWRGAAKCRIVTYGRGEMSEIRLVRCEQRDKRQSISVRFIDGAERSFELAIPGEHNALNATAALIACMVNDFDLDAVSALMPGFMGVRRRQEVRYDGAVTLIDDFAHHPTAVRETIRAIRALYPGRRLWAVFEPRSNTSRRKVFQNEYAAAFEGANQVVLCNVAARGIDAGNELLEVAELADQISRQGPPAVALADAAVIATHLLTQLQAGDVILVMSNGGFGGLLDILEAKLTSRFGA